MVEGSASPPRARRRETDPGGGGASVGLKSENQISSGRLVGGAAVGLKPENQVEARLGIEPVWESGMGGGIVAQKALPSGEKEVFFGVLSGQVAKPGAEARKH